ncbi:YciI family protein [Devosia beringensis]|uniref:YciI family protein n=1 Tax=Devosia beringensis TaxID=2657486 RepID=UPI00186B66E2|nr:YciI family protein [Devosia beringensis]
MSKFIFVFRGGMPDSPEAGQKMMTEWNAWLAGMGKAVLDPGAGLGKSSFLDADGKTAPVGDPVSGYMLVEADSMATALMHAKTCPIFSARGTIEVAETMVMQP